jgi:hypothetical protein
MNLACLFGFHDWFIDWDEGPSGHSVDECIAFLFADRLHCARCPKVIWLPKDATADIPRRASRTGAEP